MLKLPEWLARDFQAQMLVNITRPMLLLGETEPGLTLDEAYVRVDQNSHGPKLSQVMPECLWPENTWYWLPAEYEDD